jgi:hypothetical protein
MIPLDYAEWRRCIEVDCGLVLSPTYIDERVAELSDTSHFRTAQFTRLYGDGHRQRVLEWFARARRESGD